MAKIDPEVGALREELAEAQAQVEALQAAVADAEARASTAHDRSAALEAESQASREEAERLAGRLREAAVKYREARLEAAPHIPSDLVRGEAIEQIDEELAAAVRAAGEMRDRMETERRQETPPVPTGSPVRKAPDYSALPAAEKIKMGLEELSR